jgi:putative flavoprotein involved in K+ transport
MTPPSDTPTMSVLGAVVIGAGQAGLATSYHLTARGIEHVVLERRRIGDTWLSQRWDSFVLNTPGWRSHLREDDPERRADDDTFLSAPAWVGRLERFAARHALAVRAGVTVTGVSPTGSSGDGFVVSVSGPVDPDELHARSVIVASGILNVPRIPAIAAALPAGLPQFTAAEYRTPAAVPSGAVLVVGGAQTGVQLAEDLLYAGRTVCLCTSSVGRMPRRYRGRDMFAWLGDAGFFEQTPDRLPDPRMMLSPQPQVSGLGPLGRTVSLQGLAGEGVTLLGRPVAVDGQRIALDDSVGANIAFGDRVSGELKQLVDRYIDGAGIDARSEPDRADEPHPDPASVHSPAVLDLAAAGIGSVIWATGFGGDFGYLPVGALDERGVPAHERGVGRMAGLFVVGFPWLSKRKSGIIPGVDEDAERIAGLVAGREIADDR